MIPARFASTFILAALAFSPLASAAAGVTLTEAEVKRILTHGPWPLPQVPDASNRVSGKIEAIELGSRLFFDPRLSGQGQLSCASCHVPERNWTDNLTRGEGSVVVDRNTPTLMNLRATRFFGWDGAADSLWSQNLRPILDRRELAATPKHVADFLRNDPMMSCRYDKAFGAPPSKTDDESVLVGVGKAIASFLETLVSGRTPFDRFRDSLAKNEPPSQWNFSEPALRGLKIFVGKGECTNCHSGPNFTGGGFFSTGLSRYEPHGRPDPGRPEGVRTLLGSRFNLLGPYNDDKSGASGELTRKAIEERGHAGEFKVPSLRNLLLTAPYGRDGRAETLGDVIKHYASLDTAKLLEKGATKDVRPSRSSTPLNLTREEQTDLLVFLETLSTFTNPWRPEHNERCD